MKKTVHFSCFISALLFCHSDDERDNTVKHHATLRNDPQIHSAAVEKRTTHNALIQNFINGNAYIKTHWQCSFNHHHCHCIKDGGRPEPVPILPKTPSPENGPLLWFTIQHFNNCPLNILVHWESFFFVMMAKQQQQTIKNGATLRSWWNNEWIHFSELPKDLLLVESTMYKANFVFLFVSCMHSPFGCCCHFNASLFFACWFADCRKCRWEISSMIHISV